MRLIAVIIILVFYSCGSEVQNENSADVKPSPLTTKSIYGNWTLQEIIDSLYTDTITHRNYFDSTLVDTFYLKRIEYLVSKIKEDGNDSLTLFPETPFDKVTGKDAWVSWAGKTQTTLYGPRIDLNKSQTQRLMQIINNPLNFNWAECGTWTPSSRFEFFYKGELIRILDVGCSWQLKTNFQKVKFGTFKNGKDFRNLCNEIGLKNE